MLSELILTPDETDDDERGRYYDPIAGGTQFTTLYPPNTSVPDRMNWISKHPVPNAPANGAPAANVRPSKISYVSVRSYHNGGVNFVTADGAVHFISDSIDTVVVHRLGQPKRDEAEENSLVMKRLHAHRLAMVGLGLLIGLLASRHRGGFGRRHLERSARSPWRHNVCSQRILTYPPQQERSRTVHLSFRCKPGEKRVEIRSYRLSGKKTSQGNPDRRDVYSGALQFQIGIDSKCNSRWEEYNLNLH